MTTKKRKVWWLCGALIVPLIFCALAYRATWNPPITNNDVLVRRVLADVTEIRASYLNHPQAFVLRGQDATDFVQALRVRDDEPEAEGENHGPSTDFFLFKANEKKWVSLRPGKNYDDWLLLLDDNTSSSQQKLMRVHRVTIRDLERLFITLGHKLPWV